MSTYFFILLLLSWIISTLAFIIGMFNPHKIIRWGAEDRRNRKYLFLYWSVIFLVLVLLLVSLIDNNQPPLSPEQQIKQTVEKELKEHYSLAKYHDVKIRTLDDGKIYAEINLDAEVGYNKESTLSDYNNTSAHIFKVIYTSKIPVENCSLNFNSILTNPKTGDDSVDTIYSMQLSKDAAKKINWNNVNKIDITLSTGSPFMHPALMYLK